MAALIWLHALVATAVLIGVALSRVLRAGDVAFWHRVWSAVAFAAVAVFPLAAGQAIAASVGEGRWALRTALVIYAAGTSLLCIRLIGGLLLVRRLAARGLPLEGPWRTRLRAIVGEDADRCRVHPRVQVSMAVGGDTPIVLLPEGWVRWDDGRVGAVVRHELAHLDRRDFGWNIVAAVFEACFWPNPMTWVLTKRMRLLAECACDRRAAQAIGAEAYVTVLIASARELGSGGRGSSRLAPGAATSIEARVASLLG